MVEQRPSSSGAEQLSGLAPLGVPTTAKLYPDDAEVPAELRFDDALVRPLRPDDVEKDFEAVVESRAMLRVWEQGDWPADDFTLEDNLADLEHHDREHHARVAFTFIVLTADESRSLGTVYVNPAERALRVMGADESALESLGDRQACVTFWVRESELETGLERRLFEALRVWLRSEWRFERVVFGSTDQDDRQVRLFENEGLQRLWAYPVPERDCRYVICG